MPRFPCPYLHGEVGLTGEREQHIAESHPDLLPDHRDLLAQVLSAPDQVRRSHRFGNARLFWRWFDTLREGKHVVVVVVSDESAHSHHWLITAYIARKLAQGDVEWTRS